VQLTVSVIVARTPHSRAYGTVCPLVGSTNEAPMHRNTSPLSPYLALMAALCFGIATIASPRPIAQGLLVACVLLAALSLAMNLGFLGSSPWDRRRRR